MEMKPLLTFTLLLSLAACSEKTATVARGSALDLLTRTPDALVWQAGRLVPDPEERWGELGQFGWEVAASSDGARDFLWTNRDEAFLNLPAVSRADRYLTLRLLAPTTTAKAVEVRLNSILLATVMVGNEWKEERLLAPAHCWLVGDNQLELLAKLEPVEDGRKLGVGVAVLDYDESREVVCDPATGRLALSPGTSAHYRIQPLAQGRIVLAAQAGGVGELAVSIAPVDPGTGDVASTPPQVVRLAAEQGVERAYSLPTDGGLVELSVLWSAAAQGELAVTRLVLEEATPAARPPVLLISVDTLSARHMSVYGYPLETTPNLARFAQESYVFENCITNAPWTLPSFMALMSGQYAASHRVDNNGSELWERWYLSQNRWTMAEFMRSAGYRTAGFVDNAWITESFGFPQGFDQYDASAADNNTEKHVNHDGGIRQTAAAAREFLARTPADVPWFLFVHCFDVHGPYTPPEPFDGRFDQAPTYDHERTAPAGGPDNAFGIIPTYIARGEVGAGEVPARMKTAPFEGAYDEGVQFVDDELGKLFATLRSSGVLERAWIIITADHGETMADTSYYFGHGVLEQDVLRVPLLIRPPGGKAGGLRIADTVQLVDLYPTLADLLGSRAPREHLHGQSLVPCFRGEPRNGGLALSESGPLRQASLVQGRWKIVETEASKDVQRQALFTHPILTREWLAKAELNLRERIASKKYAGDGRTPEEREQRLFAWKKDPVLARAFLETRFETGLTEALLQDIVSSPACESLVQFLKRCLDQPHYELFDLSADPLGRWDVADRFPDELARMRAALAREKERRETTRLNARPPTQPVELSAESVEALKDLGYSGGAEE